MDLKKVLKNSFILFFFLGGLIIALYFFDLQKVGAVTFKKSVDSESKYCASLEECKYNLWEKIEKTWRNPYPFQKYSTVYQLAISPEGKLLSVDLLQPSKNKEFEVEALSAIVKAQPFCAFSKEVGYDNGFFMVSFGADNVEVSIMKRSPNSIANINDQREKKTICQSLSSDRPEMKAYARNIENSVRENWNPTTDYNSTVVIQFTVNKNGSIKNLKINTDSQSPLAKKAALDAINKTKFASLPESVGLREADFRYTFIVVNLMKKK